MGFKAVCLLRPIVSRTVRHLVSHRRVYLTGPYVLVFLVWSSVRLGWRPVTASSWLINNCHSEHARSLFSEIDLDVSGNPTLSKPGFPTHRHRSMDERRTLATDSVKRWVGNAVVI